MQLLAMHIPDGYLGPQTYALLWRGHAPDLDRGGAQGEAQPARPAGAAARPGSGVLVRHHDVQRAGDRGLDRARRGGDAHRRRPGAVGGGDRRVHRPGHPGRAVRRRRHHGAGRQLLQHGGRGAVRRLLPVPAAGGGRAVGAAPGARGRCRGLRRARRVGRRRRCRVRPAAVPEPHGERSAAVRAVRARRRRAGDGPRAPLLLRLGRGAGDDGRGGSAVALRPGPAGDEARRPPAALAVGGTRRRHPAHAAGGAGARHGVGGVEPGRAAGHGRVRAGRFRPPRRHVEGGPAGLRDAGRGRRPAGLSCGRGGGHARDRGHRARRRRRPGAASRRA